MDGIQILGFTAGALVIIASLPQILKILKSKKTDDLSLQMYVILTIASFLWVLYGVVTNQATIIIPNIIFLLFNAFILFLKIKHG